MKDNLKLGFRKRFKLFIEGMKNQLKGTDVDVVYQEKLKAVTSFGMCIGIFGACVVLGYRTFIVSASIDWYQVGWVTFLFFMTLFQAQASYIYFRSYNKFKGMFNELNTSQDISDAVSEQEAMNIINSMKANALKDDNNG
jgi:hypothetical protein